MQQKSRLLLFNPHPYHKQNSTSQSGIPNIYTSHFKSHSPSDSTHSYLSLLTQAEHRVTPLINPKPQKAQCSLSEQPRRKEDQKTNLQQLSEKIAVLRRTVSQNKLISENKLSQTGQRLEILKEQYQKKERKLAQLVRTINHHFS